MQARTLPPFLGLLDIYLPLFPSLPAFRVTTAKGPKGATLRQPREVLQKDVPDPPPSRTAVIKGSVNEVFWGVGLVDAEKLKKAFTGDKATSTAAILPLILLSEITVVDEISEAARSLNAAVPSTEPSTLVVNALTVAGRITTKLKEGWGPDKHWDAGPNLLTCPAV
jgi:hypothetical protein